MDHDPRPGYTEDLELARFQVYTWVERFVRNYIERLFDTYLSDDAVRDYEPALLHADLAPDHFRYSPEAARITGVIDWDDPSIGATIRSNRRPESSSRLRDSGADGPQPCFLSS